MLPRIALTPDDDAVAEMSAALAAGAGAIDETAAWPAEQLELCRQYGVYRWFAGESWGGLGWDDAALIRGYLALSTGCLTTAFILTQREGACQRIESSANEPLKRRLMASLTSGDHFATIGISHLTTSRQHLAKPALAARRVDGGFILDGYSPWVTGAAHADYVVIGAAVMDGDRPAGQQILAVAPTSLPGVSAEKPADLVALSSSCTGRLLFDSVELGAEWLLAGPAENVMARGVGGGTGGLQTTTLALGLAGSAIRFIAQEAERRTDLTPALAALQQDAMSIETALMAVVAGEPRCTNDELRQRANSLVLRSTQAALAAAKGAGYVSSHPAGRWCREALFFLVWSCPQPVVSAQLCELAGILD